MSLFRIVKYSSILFFLGKYKSKLFRVVCVLLFALTTSLLYQDVAEYLQEQHPETVIYALVAKIFIAPPPLSARAKPPGSIRIRSVGIPSGPGS